MRWIATCVRMAADMRKQGNKRRVERIPIGAPLAGKIGSVDVLIRDVSVLGCRIEHDTAIRTGQQVLLQFEWDGETVALGCEVVRCTLSPPDTSAAGGSAYTSGLRFEDSASVAARTLRAVIQTQVEHAFEEQLANAHGNLPDYLRRIAIIPGSEKFDPIEIRKKHESTTLLPWLRFARKRGYVSWSLTNGRWKRVRTANPKQPDEGFTIWAWESDEQIELLQKAYEIADAPFRSIIRLCAELSLIVDDTVPPQKFLPYG